MLNKVTITITWTDCKKFYNLLR